MLAACHVLEKGLAFPEPKRPFGQDLAEFVCTTMTDPDRRPSDNVAAIARGVLAKYRQHHDKLSHDLGALGDAIASVVESGPAAEAGTLGLSSGDFRPAAGSSYETLTQLRKSVRDFAGPPAQEQIEEAVALASKSPSACNRQCWRVYWTRDRERCAAIADMHSGSRGFGNDVPAWIAVAVDVAAFQGPRERWAAYVDGGMFAMSLLLSLTQVGLASCPLNWSTSPAIDRRLRQCLDVGSTEIVVMLIAVGLPPDTCEVPVSARLPVSDILRTR